MTTPLEPVPAEEAGQKTSTGLTPEVSGLLCYALGFISGVVFLVVEQENRDVRFHAFQSLATFLGLFVVSVVASVIPLIGWLISLLVPPVAVVLWVLLMWKAVQGERLRLPWVGDWAEEQARR